MDPVTLSILAGVAGTAASNLPTLLPSKLAQQNKTRLEALKRREELGMLGLTEEEQSAMENRLQAPARAAQDAADFERKRLLAGTTGATGGQALEQALAAEQQQMQQQTDIAGRVLQADLQEQERERNDMRALEAAGEQRRQEIAGALGGLLGGGLEAGLSTSAQQAIIQGKKDISPTALQGLSSSLGVSTEEARGIYEMSLENPQLMEYMIALQGKGAK